MSNCVRRATKEASSDGSCIASQSADGTDETITERYMTEESTQARERARERDRDRHNGIYEAHDNHKLSWNYIFWFLSVFLDSASAE